VRKEMIWPYYKKRKLGRLRIAMEINLKEKREREREQKTDDEIDKLYRNIK